tara:strand:+ start:679 stop:1527 length:849 start_codon:yes stop_codon:yes gene_type:complete
MKKINLKSILKKTFKKKNKASKKTNKIKVSKPKKNKVKILKKGKKGKKIKVEKQKETQIKTVEKNKNLRISKQNEVKPEIKKIQKQETEKKLFKPKDYVVYPKHGVGQILSINSKTIGGIDVQCYDIKFEKDKAVGLLPINKQSHLRPLSTINQVNKSISILKSKPKIKRSMWSRRAQEYEQKITSGKIYELAEVVRDLNKGDDIMVDQSYSERQLFEKAYERILSEFQIVLGLSYEDTAKKLNKALKRNLDGQNQEVKSKPVETSINTENEIEESVEDNPE